jgi:hypothetical protein
MKMFTSRCASEDMKSDKFLMQIKKILEFDHDNAAKTFSSGAFSLERDKNDVLKASECIKGL